MRSRKKEEKGRSTGRRRGLLRGSVSLLILLSIISCSRIPGIGGGESETILTAEERRLNGQSFVEMWETIRDKNWDTELNGLDWQAVHDEYLPKVEAATTMFEARLLMEEMIELLGQSHIAVIPAEVYKKTSGGDKGKGRSGIDVRVVDGHALVVSVDSGSPAESKGVHTGWEIVRIDGEEISFSLEEVFKEYEGETTCDYRMAMTAMRRLSGPIGETVSVTFVDGEGNEVDVEITLGERRGNKTEGMNMPPTWVWSESRRLDGDVAYIRFNLFLDLVHVMPFFNKTIQENMDCRGVVVDLRGNLGGLGVMAMGMCGWFVEERGLHLGTTIMRNGELNFVLNPRAETYKGKLAILVDGLSASTSEIFAGGLQGLGRARVFGTRTAGQALPSFFMVLSNKDRFQYTTANYISEGGVILEGNGVTPDVVVGPTREALLRGEDRALESALEWIALNR